MPSKELNEWQKEFKIKELTEKDLENFEELIFADKDKIDRPMSQTKHGWMLRWAIRSGWIESPVCETKEVDGVTVYMYGGKSVDDMHGGAVRWIGQKIDAAYTDATSVPKNL